MSIGKTWHRLIFCSQNNTFLSIILQATPVDIAKMILMSVAQDRARMGAFVPMALTAIDVAVPLVSQERTARQMLTTVLACPIPVLMEVLAVTLLLPLYVNVRLDILDLDVK